jgi:mRNA interferase YafQ
MQARQPRGHRKNDQAVKRILIPTKAFLRDARKLARKNSRAHGDLVAAMELLAEDALHPALRSHKLKGSLAPSWACSAGYDLRIVFHIVRQGTTEVIVLETAGTHDEVY